MKAAVLGKPITHSLSPVLHNAAYQALGLEHSYAKIEVAAEELGSFLASLDSDWLGVSLTMPLKEVAFEFADSIDEIATLCGSINTLVFGEKVRAFNTDVFGIVDAVNETGLDEVESGVIFGSGATARSSLVALSQLGAQRIACVARNKVDLQKMATLALDLGVEFKSTSVNDSGWMSVDLVVNTTPVGVLDDLAREVLAPTGLLLDVVYHPWPTQLAASWAVTGGSIISGLSMLLHQAGHQVSLMTGEPAPISQMRDGLNIELLTRGLSTI